MESANGMKLITFYLSKEDIEKLRKIEYIDRKTTRTATVRGLIDFRTSLFEIFGEKSIGEIMETMTNCNGDENDQSNHT